MHTTVPRRMAEVVTVGRFGFCSLLEAGKRHEVECFVAAVEDDCAVIFVPKALVDEYPSNTARGSDTSDWDLAGAPATGSKEVPLKAVDFIVKVGGAEVALQVLKVKWSSVRSTAVGRDVKLRFAEKPATQVLFSAFYQSELGSTGGQDKLPTCSTADESRPRGDSRPQGRGSRKNRGTSPVRAQRIHSDGDGDTAGTDGDSEMSDPLIRRVKEFQYGSSRQESPRRSKVRGAAERGGQRARRDGYSRSVSSEERAPERRRRVHVQESRSPTPTGAANIAGHVRISEPTQVCRSRWKGSSC